MANQLAIAEIKKVSTLEIVWTDWRIDKCDYQDKDNVIELTLCTIILYDGYLMASMNDSIYPKKK